MKQDDDQVVITADDYDPAFWGPKTPEAEAFFQRMAMEKMIEMAPAVQKLFAQKR
jgi:hypothetical protein